MSLDRLDRVIASQARIDNYLADMASALRGMQGEFAAQRRERLEGRLGPFGTTIGALLGRTEPTVGSGSIDPGNTAPKVGQGNQLADPMLDTTKTATLATAEAGLTWDLFGKYLLNSGTAPTTRTVDLVPWSGGSTMASSMLALLLTGAAAGNITAQVYTKSAITIATNSPDLPYIVAACRLFAFASPRTLTNVTTWSATIELLRNGTTVVSSRTVDLTSLPAGGSIAVHASGASPFTAGDTYDIRVKVDLVTTGAGANLRVGIGEPAVEFALTPDPTAFIGDRAGARGWFGDGSDGDLVVSAGTTTMTADRCYENVTVAAGATLKTNGYRLYVRNRLVNAGTISNAGSPGTAATSATVVGVGGAGGPGGSLLGGTAGGNGGTGNGVAGTNQGTVQFGGVGGNGGKASTGAYNGGAGGTGTYPAANGTFRDPALARLGTIASGVFLQPGAGGGGGAGDTPSVTAGGGAGGGGGMLVIAARYIDNSAGTIGAPGGNGGNGWSTTGGGGAGGGGGIVLLVYDVMIRGTETAAGGTKGTSGGAAATDGQAGFVLYLRG